MLQMLARTVFDVEVGVTPAAGLNVCLVAELIQGHLSRDFLEMTQAIFSGFLLPCFSFCWS